MKKILIIGAGAMGAAFSVPLIDNNQKLKSRQLQKLKNQSMTFM